MRQYKNDDDDDDDNDDNNDNDPKEKKKKEKINIFLSFEWRMEHGGEKKNASVGRNVTAAK